MDIQRLRYFLEVARQKSFSRAAQACHISQPSLSQQIKKLEEEVDGLLFLRNRGRITLSPLGESFLKYAQAIMASVASAEEFVAEARIQACRTIRFGAIPTIAPYLMPGIFAALRQLEPTVKLELLEARTDTITQALIEGTIDFALLSPPTAIDNVCDHMTLLRDDLLLSLPANHHLAKVKSITPAELAGENIILLEDSHCLSRQASAYCERMGLTADISIRGSQIETILRLVEQGFGITFTPRIAVGAYDDTKLVFRPLAKMACHREICLLWLRQPMPLGSLKLTLEAMRQRFQVDGGGKLRMKDEG